MFTTRAIAPTIIGRTSALALSGNNRFSRLANLTGTEVLQKVAYAGGLDKRLFASMNAGRGGPSPKFKHMEVRSTLEKANETVGFQELELKTLFHAADAVFNDLVTFGIIASIGVALSAPTSNSLVTAAGLTWLMRAFHDRSFLNEINSGARQINQRSARWFFRR